jgi:transposase-like protein
MERRKFPREFKLEAVRLIKERGVSYGQASQDLGVHESQLRGWVKALADDCARGLRSQRSLSVVLRSLKSCYFSRRRYLYWSD